MSSAVPHGPPPSGNNTKKNTNYTTGLPPMISLPQGSENAAHETTSGLRNKTTLMALGTGVGIGGVMVLVFVCIFAVWYKRRNRKPASDELFTSNSHRPIPKKDTSLPSLMGRGCDQWWIHDNCSVGLQNLESSFPNLFPDDPLHCPQYHLENNTPSHAVGSIANKPLSPDIISFSQQFSDVSLPPPPPIMSSSSYDRRHQHVALDTGLGLAKTTFSYEELESATAQFSCNNILGEGGFGLVYKGVLHDGKEVAIKRLKHGSGQGEREFQAEVEMISRVQHKHLVSLVGYCTSGDQRLLVYEFVSNKTLDFHLHDECPSVTWANRMKIALGSAKGLACLHEDCQPKIIHRDVKASNILLDDDFVAKVADFGLARLNYDTDTHVSTRVMGTFGYLAPEYALTGKLTAKSDVFSFGVMLLELITGRRPIDKAQHYLDDNIVDWARPLLSQALEDGNFDSVADQRLQKNYDRIEMTRMVACASVCVRHLARHRPRMSQVIQALEGTIPLEDLNKGLKPGHSTILGFHGSSDYDNVQYKEDLKKFKKMALGSEEDDTS